MNEYGNVSREMTCNNEIDAERVTLCPDGKYRWVYEYPMMKHPVLFLTILKVIAISFAVPGLIVFFSAIGREGVIEALLSALKMYVLVLAIGCVLSLVAYLTVSAGYGWKYIVVFVMDEEGIEHIQQPKQFEKAQAIGAVTALAGGFTGNAGRTGQGILTATHGSLSSRFSAVKKIKGMPNAHVIKVNSLFSKNQVYVKEEDYGFVWEYITKRCPNAKISG